MAEYVFPALVLVGACLAAIALVLGTMSSVRLTRNLDHGLMHHFFYALLLSNGILILLSTRNFTAVGEVLDQETTGNPLASWSIRLSSLIAMAASIDWIARRFRSDASTNSDQWLLIMTVSAFWLGNILVPAFLSTHTAGLKLNWVYTPILCIGLILLSADGGQRCILYCRNSVFVFCLVSLLLIAVRPSLVMDYNYTQGFIKSLPRFAGLAPHAVAMGLLACIGFWLTFYWPFKWKSLQWLAQFLCLSALALSQAKGAWLTFLAAIPVLFLSRHSIPSFNAVSRSKYRQLAALALVLLAVLCVAIVGYAASAGLGDKLQRFFLSAEGSQVMTFTGRDQIWEVALSEWRHSPIFGYGLPLFDLEYRLHIGMMFATHGHNQFIDTLGRAGLVGTATLSAYTATLVYMSIKYARESRGLSVVLMLALCLRMISEVPLTQGNIGMDSLTHYLLLVVLAMCIGTRTATMREPA